MFGPCTLFSPVNNAADFLLRLRTTSHLHTSLRGPCAPWISWVTCTNNGRELDLLGFLFVCNFFSKLFIVLLWVVASKYLLVTFVSSVGRRTGFRWRSFTPLRKPGALFRIVCTDNHFMAVNHRFRRVHTEKLTIIVCCFIWWMEIDGELVERRILTRKRRHRQSGKGILIETLLDKRKQNLCEVCVENALGSACWDYTSGWSWSDWEGSAENAVLQTNLDFGFHWCQKSIPVGDRQCMKGDEWQSVCAVIQILLWLFFFEQFSTQPVPPFCNEFVICCCPTRIEKGKLHKPCHTIFYCKSKSTTRTGGNT